MEVGSGWGEEEEEETADSPDEKINKNKVKSAL